MTAQVDGIDGVHGRERLAAWFEGNSEGLWRIDLQDALPCTGTEKVEAEHIIAFGTIAECNAAMASMLNEVRFVDPIGSALDPVGRPLNQYPLFAAIIESLIKAEFDLVDWELVDRASHKSFVVSAVGAFEDGCLVRIWGRCREAVDERHLEARMMNALDEQQREIGYELHDGLGQLLIAARMVSYNIAALVNVSEDEIRAQCNHLASLTDQSLELLQRITQELTPGPFVNGTSLNDALESLANTTNRFLNVYCTYSYDEDGDAESIDSEKQIHVYRIMQEALNNAVKHAEARHVQMSLKRTEPGLLQFEVSDDGIGFKKEEKGKNSLGLKSMIHRARLIGARLQIESAPGKSTTIRCAVPV